MPCYSPGEISQRLRLTLVISQGEAEPRSLVELADLAFAGGVTAIQLREKNMADRQLYETALALGRHCRAHKKLFIINDRLDLALAVGADGLHLGQADLPVEVASRLMPKNKLLGISVANVEAGRLALAEGADYLGIGAIFPTGSKCEAPVVRPEEVKGLVALGAPTVAIGGITKINARQVWAMGFTGLAVISALAAATDPSEVARQLIKAQG